MAKLIECSCCGEKFPPEKIYYGDEGCPSEGQPICEVCFDGDEPVVILHFSNEENPIFITEFRNDTLLYPNLPFFRVKWVSIDAWRGYYEAESDEYEKIHSDCILSYSEDAEELKKFDEAIEKIFNSLGVPFCKVFSRTSNLFSSGYDLFLKRGFKEKVEEFIEELKREFRDPYRFYATALTGKDPQDFNEKDKKFIRGSLFLKLGFSPEQAIEIVNLLDELKNG